jgi:geranylgeranyl diphosphate synthase type II
MLNTDPIFELADDAEAIRELVDQRLAQLVPGALVPPKKLHRAIRYSLLAPGKRVRPILALHATRAFGGTEQAALDPACAIEMVHAASLIVDDFPFMDDATERRGMPVNHRAFGMETATLASFALLNRAFSVLAEAPGLASETRIQLVRRLSSALGDCGGAIAGQEEDLEAPRGEDASIEELETMVAHKTGALFVAAVEAGALVAGASAEALTAARSFGWNFGLCFQALDDLKDRPGPASDADSENNRDSPAKLTFVSVLGVEAAWRAAQGYAWDAVGALDTVGLGGSSLAGVASNLLGVRRPGRTLSSL